MLVVTRYSFSHLKVQQKLIKNLYYFFLFFFSFFSKDSKVPLKSSLHHIVSIHNVMPVKKPKLKKDRKKEVEDFLISVFCAFFDGAEQNNICGCGVHVIMDEKLQYFLSWNGGSGSNSLAEARALAGLLAFCVFFGIQNISIYGDSKSMIDHVRGACNISCPHLSGWMDKIMYFWRNMKQCSIHYIFRSQNVQADRLSKKGLSLGSWSMMVSDGERSCFIQDFSIPGL